VERVGDTIHSITKTKDGHLRIVLNRESVEIENLQTAIKTTIGNYASCTRLTDWATEKCLSQLFSQDQNTWSAITDYKCPNYNVIRSFKRKHKITLASGYIVLQLKLFTTTSCISGQYVSSKITDFIMKGISSSSLMINKAQYKPVSAIIHIESNSNSGHYIIYLKHTDSTWVCANDTEITEKSLPENGKENFFLAFWRDFLELLGRTFGRSEDFYYWLIC